MGESLTTSVTTYGLSGQQVRDTLGISKWKFIEMVKSGELDAITVGSHFRVSEESVKAFIERNRVVPS